MSNSRIKVILIIGLMLQVVDAYEVNLLEIDINLWQNYKNIIAFLREGSYNDVNGKAVKIEYEKNTNVFQIDGKDIVSCFVKSQSSDKFEIVYSFIIGKYSAQNADSKPFQNTSEHIVIKKPDKEQMKYSTSDISTSRKYFIADCHQDVNKDGFKKMSQITTNLNDVSNDKSECGIQLREVVIVLNKQDLLKVFGIESKIYESDLSNSHEETGETVFHWLAGIILIGFVFYAIAISSPL